MFNRFTEDQPGLEYDGRKEDISNAMYPVIQKDPERTNGSNYVPQQQPERTTDNLYVPQQQPNAEEKEEKEKKVHRYPFGLRPLWFGIIIAIVTTIIVAAVVGGIVAATVKPSSKSR